MSEPTITIGDKSLTVSGLMRVIYTKLFGDSFAASQAAEGVVKKAIKLSTHDANLLEALEDGAAFCIAFKKKDATEWTRVWVEDAGALQAAAIREIGLRQMGLMKNLANVFGIFPHTI